MQIIIDEDGRRLVGLAEFMAIKGKDRRTILRWLGEGEVPGAFKDEHGHWQIPDDADRVKKPVQEQGAGQDVVPAGSARVAQLVPHNGWPAAVEGPAEKSRLERLDDERSYLTIEQAAEYLGIPQAQIRANAERYRLESVGIRSKQHPEGSLRMPKSVIREIEGRA